MIEMELRDVTAFFMGRKKTTHQKSCHRSTFFTAKEKKKQDCN
jgi:hypothetical protein